MSRRGWWRSRPALTSADHITPELMISHSDEMSQRSGLGVEGGQDRPGEGVADDRHLGDPLGLDGVEQRLDVEMRAVRA